ncbi:hypothetical protein [Paraburkholderia nodosa]|uniref:hypothetical protein n=1 Tax=Paraburkholderia nodosa TaxID=392320 RepID=UPI00114D0626|nr:hypothetical protein [Paraburkholderia nodosa]
MEIKKLTPESSSRRGFIKWIVSSFLLAQAAPNGKLLGTLARPKPSIEHEWSNLSVEQQSRALFGRQVPQDARLIASARNGGVTAAVFEADLRESSFASVARWLCIAPERSSGIFAIQVTGDAMAISSSFHPVVVTLQVLGDGAVEVSEQHLRAHDQHVWKELGGKWCLTRKSFAGNVAHRFVTEEYDLATEQFVATEGFIENDEPYASHCVSTNVLVELGTYYKGQAIA